MCFFPPAYYIIIYILQICVNTHIIKNYFGTTISVVELAKEGILLVRIIRIGIFLRNINKLIFSNCVTFQDNQFLTITVKSGV